MTRPSRPQPPLEARADEVVKLMSPSTDEVRRSEVLTQAVLTAALALQQAQDELCRLDSVAGDGDEGLGMARAGRSIHQRLSKGAPLGVAQILDLVATEMSAVGGAMGALSYVIISSIADALSTRNYELTAGSLAELLSATEAAVSEFGGAKRGDKSILDAIAFARDAAVDAASQHATTKDATLAVLAATREGVAATADMEARVGRASRLGPRTRGSIDAGAQTFMIALAALVDVYVSTSAGTHGNDNQRGRTGLESSYASDTE